MAPIISGYTEAMAVAGKNSEIVSYLAASLSLLILIFRQNEMSKLSKTFLFCTLFVFLFLSFKAGFVRHDGHATIASESLLITALLFPFIFNSKSIFLGIILSITAWAYIDNNYNLRPSPAVLFNNLRSTYSYAWQGLEKRISDTGWPSSHFDIAVHSLKEQASFPILPGRTDIYSHNQSFLIASGNSWSPRPVFQSYFVYTPYLAEINRSHLLGSHAPDNIIFAVEPIDGRIPSIEDGASWPVLLQNYKPVSTVKGFLILHKNANAAKMAEASITETKTVSFGERVVLPQGAQATFATIKVKPTIFGRLANIFFKPAQLQVILELKNGSINRYRIISGMAESGFLISPLVISTEAFALLYGNKNYLSGSDVKEFYLTTSRGGRAFWDDRYIVTLSEIRLPSASDIFKRINVSNYKIIKREKCDGSIDAINGTSPSSGRIGASGTLRVEGWLANSIDRPALPDAVYLVLVDDKGNQFFFETRQVLRPDVGAHFKKSELNNAGFVTNVDVLAFTGQYTLGLAMSYLENIEMCPPSMGSIINIIQSQ
jgi:hypothetical protein